MGKTFLECLPDAERVALMDRLMVEQYTSGKTIVAHEEDTKDVFFLLEGKARTEIFSPEGKVTSFREVLPGAIFGELAAIDGAPRSASVIADENVRVGRLRHSQFVDLSTTNTAFIWALVEYMAAQVRTMTHRVYELSTMLVYDRLIGELIRIGEATVPDADEVNVPSPPTQGQLASRLGTNREGINRGFAKLEDEGLIKKSNGDVLWIDLKGLRRSRDAPKLKG